MSLCDYGCGQPFSFEFKSGKKCCSKTTNSCPEMRLRNGAGVSKFINQFDNPNDRWLNGHPKGMLGKAPVNKGQTVSAEIIAKTKATKATRTYAPYSHSSETKAIISAAMKGKGGYREGSGRGRKGRYKGYWCDSSYELAWIIFQLDHGIDFERNTSKFDYTFEGRNLKWIPDFRLPDGSYVEIKGYETTQSRAKIESFPHPIVVLKEKDLQPIFSYVIHKYGRDFTSLYG